ncbi:hypothetical protein GGI42DRAFT_333073 [Trichoderma sp. SZMC 28013]
MMDLYIQNACLLALDAVWCLYCSATCCAQASKRRALRTTPYGSNGTLNGLVLWRPHERVDAHGLSSLLIVSADTRPPVTRRSPAQ